MPMVRQVIPHYEFSRRTLCLYVVQGYFPILFETHVPRDSGVFVRIAVSLHRMANLSRYRLMTANYRLN